MFLLDQEPFLFLRQRKIMDLQQLLLAVQFLLKLVYQHFLKESYLVDVLVLQLKVQPYLNQIDLLLIMTVNPGYGGQSFITNMVSKIQRIRTLLDTIGSDSELEVDGGINTTTAKEVVKAGADVLVAGSAIYNNTNSVKEAISSIRKTYNR